MPKRSKHPPLENDKHISNNELSFRENDELIADENFVHIDSMESKIRIVALAAKIARLCDQTQDVSEEARALARRFQVMITFALSTEATQRTTKLPDSAPEKWLERKNKKETPFDFVKRVYAPFIGRGLTRPHIKAIDLSLYNAIKSWKSNGGSIPEDFAEILPTKRKSIDQKLADSGLMDGSASEETKEILRLYHVAKRRCRTPDS